MAKKVEISVEEKLRALFDLQLIDSRIDEIRSVRGELPLEVEDLENEISMSQKLLSDPDFYQNPDAQNLTIKLSSMEKEVVLLYDKWSELDSGN